MYSSIQCPPSPCPRPSPIPSPSKGPDHVQKVDAKAARIKLDNLRFFDEVVARFALVSPPSTRAPSSSSSPVCSPPREPSSPRTRTGSEDVSFVMTGLAVSGFSTPASSSVTRSLSPERPSFHSRTRTGSSENPDIESCPIRTLDTLLEVLGDGTPLSYSPVCVNGSTLKQTADGSFQGVLRAQVNESIKHKGHALVVMANGNSMINTEMATGKGHRAATKIVNASCSAIEPIIDEVIASSNDPSAVEQVTVDELCQSKENKPLLDHFMDHCNQDPGLKQLMNELLRDLYDQRAEMRNKEHGDVPSLFKKNQEGDYILPLEVRTNMEAKKRLNSLRDAIMPEVFFILGGISYKDHVYKGMEYIVKPSYLEKGRSNSGMGLIAACAENMRPVLFDIDLPPEFYKRLDLPGHIKLYTRDDTPPQS